MKTTLHQASISLELQFYKEGHFRTRVKNKNKTKKKLLTEGKA